MTKNRDRIDQKGFIAPLIIVVLIATLFVWYFMSSKKNEALEIKSEDETGYKDCNILALDTLSLLTKGSIVLEADKSARFKNRNYSIKITRGKDLAVEKEVYQPYLIETIDEENPTTAYQYLAVGRSKDGVLTGLSIAFSRQKLEGGS